MPSAYSSNEIMNFFSNKIDKIRQKIQNTRLNSTNLLPYKANPDLENIVHTAERLESFTLIQQTELVNIISSSKSSTCILDPIPTGLLKEILPEITYSVNNKLLS